MINIDTDVLHLNRRVLVVGDVMLDVFHSGQVSRISPEAPVPVFVYKETDYRLGGAANVAANLTAFGCSVTLLCSYAKTQQTVEFEKLCDQYGINLINVESVHALLTNKERYISSGQQVFRLDKEEMLSDADRTGLLNKFKEIYSDYQAVILSDYNKGALFDAFRYTQICKNDGISCLVDPKVPDWDRYKGANLIKPNFKEFCDLKLGSTLCASNISQYIRSKSIDNIIVTQGREGATYINKYDKVLHVKSPLVSVSDVTGAGDVFLACLGAFFNKSDVDLDYLLTICNKLAGLSTSKIGTYVLRSSDINLSDSSRVDPFTSIKDAVAICEKFKCENPHGSISFTNGCFDILHPGHLKTLEELRISGQLAILGLNSDMSIRRLKGSKRPVNGSEFRAEMLKMLPFVDHVILFEEESPLELIKTLQPDVLIKGGDYSMDQIIGAEMILEKGGEVKIIPHYKHYSTSEIIRKVRS